jgi:hypothetical protein
MSPRPAPTRGDDTARRFLDAAAQLIDAMFVSSVDHRPTRLRSLDFPAALEWLRIEDVVRLTEGASRKAFHNRWETKDAIIRDAVIHTILFRDQPDADPTATDHSMFVAAAERSQGSLSRIVALLADEMLNAFLHNAILDRLHETRRPWYEGYGYLLTTLGMRLRPGWTIERVGMAITAMLDGFLLRTRVHPAEMRALRWEDASLFADTITAFSLGVVDAGSGLSARAALDATR